MSNLNAEPSPPTRSVPHFAQEIIDKIIDELSFDKTTLKQCSTVSQSFHVPSCRHLFSFIVLDTVKQVTLFHRLLIRTPDIGRNVREFMLCLSDGWEDVVDGEGKEKCFAISNLLADVFALLPCVNSLIWYSAVCHWDELSSDLRLALLTLFQRPSLAAITILHVDNLPLSVLHVVSPVKRLMLQFVQLHSSDQTQVILPHLEALTINSNVSQPAEVELLVPNLHWLSLWDDGDHLQGVALAQQAINGSARTLQRLWWLYDLERCM
jgi:hypothetical protein